MTYELLHYFLTVNYDPLTGCETADEVYELLDPTETRALFLGIISNCSVPLGQEKKQAVIIDFFCKHSPLPWMKAVGIK